MEKRFAEARHTNRLISTLRRADMERGRLERKLEREKARLQRRTPVGRFEHDTLVSEVQDLRKQLARLADHISQISHYLQHGQNRPKPNLDAK
jgi:hypothetical protein